MSHKERPMNWGAMRPKTRRLERHIVTERDPPFSFRRIVHEARGPGVKAILKAISGIIPP
jgi:hypothetical protein